MFETTYVRRKVQPPLKDCPDTPEELSNKGGSVRVVTKEEELKHVDKRWDGDETRIRIPGMDGQTGSISVKYIEEIDMDEPIPARESYRSRLRVFRPRITDKSYWRGVWKPIPLVCYPAILFSTIVHGLVPDSLSSTRLTVNKIIFPLADWYEILKCRKDLTLTKYVAEVLVSLHVLTNKPYDLDPSQVGLTKIPHMLAALISAPLAGILSDWIAKFLTKKNNGIFEPEFRLLLMVIAVPVSTVSFIGFGIAAERKETVAWILFWGVLQSVSSPFGTQAAVSYILDCYPQGKCALRLSL